MNSHSRIGILLLIVAIVGWFAVVRPSVTKFAAKTLDAKAAAINLKSYDQRISDLKLIKEKGDAVQKTLRAMFLAMPSASQVPEVLVMIESIGANSGVVFSAVTLGTPTGANADVAAALDPTVASAVAEVPVTISFSGNLDSVNKFVTAVNHNVRTATIKSQTINSDKAGAMNVTMLLGLVYQGGN